VARQRALTGAGAASIAVIAILAGAPGANAQPTSAPASKAAANLAERGFPGATDRVFAADGPVGGNFIKLPPCCD
jgi:hypothetical protein